MYARAHRFSGVVFSILLGLVASVSSLYVLEIMLRDAIPWLLAGAITGGCFNIFFERNLAPKPQT